MTAHPIDTEALRGAASAHEPDDHGPGKCGKDDCFTSCAECGEDWPCPISQIPDALAAAEHRATRAEAQSEARRINADYWKGVARGNAIAADVWKESAEEAQARVKAVEDVLDRKDADLDAMSNPPREHRGVLMADIRRALEG